MIGSFYLTRNGNKVRRQGINEPWMDVVNETADVLVVKRPGRRVNMSGVRGMPDIRHFPSEFIVFRLHEGRVTEIISFPTRRR